MDHEAALKAAPKTDLPISDRAREICRAMDRGWKGKSARGPGLISGGWHVPDGYSDRIPAGSGLRLRPVGTLSFAQLISANSNRRSHPQ